MTTNTNAKLAAVANTDLTTLPPAKRAALALKSEQTRKDLAALVANSAGIVKVLNGDAREQAHRIGMTLKNARVTIEKTGKAAREDATAFSKAVIAEEKALIALVEPEEARVLKLRDEWDAKIEAEKQVKIAAERARVEAIQGRIEAMRNAPLGVVGKSPAEILSARDAVRDTIIDDSFAEFKDRAMTVRSEAFNALEATHQQAVEAEAAALAAEEARKAEASRIEAERAELARLRAEQAERERLAKVESDRIAVEQAAEAKRLADLAAAQEAEARRAREAAEAELRAERERIAAEQAAAAADIKAAQDKLAVEWAAHEARMQLERDHADALGMNVELNARREAERARLQALADQAAADTRLPAPESVNAHDLPIDFGASEGPDDNEIIALVCEVYGMHRSAAIDRLAAIDFNAAREFQS